MEQCVDDVQQRLTKLETDYSNMKQNIIEMFEELKAMRKDVADLLSIHQNIRTGLNFLRLTGKVLTWFASVAVAVAVLLGLSHKGPIDFNIQP